MVETGYLRSAGKHLCGMEHVVQEIEKKLLFVTGKGGVGKSTVALLTANYLKSLGRKVLLVELGRRSSFSSLTGETVSVQFSPQATPFGFDLSLMDGQGCLSGYVSYFVKLDRIADLFLNNRFMKGLLPLAPGLDDLAVLGQLTASLRQHGPELDYDHIVVDAPSTGAFLSMLKAPKFLSEMVDVGPLRKQSESIFEILNDPGSCHFLFVTLLESFPVDELLESVSSFRETFQSPLTVIANKVLPTEDRKGLKPAAFDQFLEQSIHRQQAHLQRLGETFPLLGQRALTIQSVRQTFQEKEARCPFSKDL